MSVYSGFATRQIEQSYNSLLETLLIGLGKRLLAFYSKQSVPEATFADLLKRNLSQMAILERQKYLPPKFSETTKELVMFLRLIIPSNDNIATKRIKGKETSNRGRLLSEQKQKEAIAAVQNGNWFESAFRNQDAILMESQKQLKSSIAPFHLENQKDNNSNWLSEESFGEPKKCVFANSRITQEQQPNGSLRRTQNEPLPQHPSLVISEPLENQNTPLKQHYENGSKLMNTIGASLSGKNTNYLTINKNNNHKEGSAIQEEEEEELSFQKESERDLTNNDQLPSLKDQEKDNKRKSKRATTTKRQRKRNLLLNQVYSTEEIQLLSKRSKSLQKGTKSPEINFNPSREDQSINRTNNIVGALKENSQNSEETAKLENDDKYESIDSHKSISSMNKQRAISLQDAFALKSNDMPANNNLIRQKTIPKNEKQIKLTNAYNAKISADPNTDREESNNIAYKLITNNDSSIMSKQANNSSVFFPLHSEKQQSVSRQKQNLIDTMKPPSNKYNQQTTSEDINPVKNSNAFNASNHQAQYDTSQSTYRSFSTEKSKFSASQIYQKANFELQKKSGIFLDSENTTNNLWSPSKQHFVQLRRRQEALSQLWPLSNCNEMYSKGYCPSSSSSNGSHIYSATNKQSSNSKRGQPSTILRQAQRTSCSFSSTQSTAKKENNNNSSEKEQDYIFSSMPTRPSLPLTLAQISNRMATTPSRTNETDITQ